MCLTKNSYIQVHMHVRAPIKRVWPVTRLIVHVAHWCIPTSSKWCSLLTESKGALLVQKGWNTGSGLASNRTDMEAKGHICAYTPSSECLGQQYDVLINEYMLVSEMHPIRKYSIRQYLNIIVYIVSSILEQY